MLVSKRYHAQTNGILTREVLNVKVGLRVVLRAHSRQRHRVHSSGQSVPEAVDGREVSGVPDVESGAEDVGLAEFLHLRLGITNLTNRIVFDTQG